MSDSTYADLTASFKNLLRRRLAVRNRNKTPMGVKYLQQHLKQCVKRVITKPDKMVSQLDRWATS